MSRQLLGSSPIRGNLVLEVLSFPLDETGSAFYVRSFHAKTTQPVWIPIDNIKIPIVFEAAFGQNLGDDALGTIVWAQSERSYSFQIDSFYLDLDIQLWPFRTNLDTFEALWWFARGSLKGGKSEADAVTMYTGLSEARGWLYPFGRDIRRSVFRPHAQPGVPALTRRVHATGL